MVFSRAKCRPSGNKKNFLRKLHILSLLCRAQSIAVHFSDFCRVHFFLDTLSCFASLGWRLKMCSKIWSRSKVGSFYLWNHTEQWISRPICAGPQILLDNFRSTLFSLISPSSIAAEQYAHCSGGKITFWSHLGEKRLENPENFHGTPSRGCIESIKSAGEISQKVGLMICPRHFLETRISRRIYIPKNAILQVNLL